MGQVPDKSINNFELIDKLFLSIDDEINFENPNSTIVLNACIITYDYCEIKNDWYLWEKWALREGVAESDTSGIILAGLGRASEEKGDLDLSLFRHKNGCNLPKNQDLISKGLGLNHHGLGIVYMRLNNLQAFSHFKLAIKIFKKLKSPYHLGCACCDAGGAYYWKLYHSRVLADKSNDYLSSFQFVSDVIMSIILYIEALVIHRIHGYEWDLTRIFYSLGFTILEVKPLRVLTKPIFRNALRWGLSIESKRYVALSHYGLGLSHYYMKNYPLARKEFVTAHNLYAKIVMDVNRPYYIENEFNISSMLCQTYLKLNESALFMEQFGSIWTTFINLRNDNKEIAAKKEVLLHIAKKAKLDNVIILLSTM